MNSKDIARLAGVSRSTVSRVLNNNKNVQPETRKKILEIIKKHNYHPNAPARMLVGQRNWTLGLFIVESGDVAKSTYYTKFIATVIEQASARGYHVLTNIIRDNQNESMVEMVNQNFYQRRIDGGIFIGAANDEAFIEKLIEDGFMVAIIDHENTMHSNDNRLIFNIDNLNSVFAVIDYLFSLGHQHIGFLNGEPHKLSAIKRYEGYLLALERHDLEVRDEWIRHGRFREEEGYMMMKEIIEQGSPMPSAIFAANDDIAIGAIKALHEHGFRVPDDISLIGFDDLLISSYFHPKLTTMRVDFEQIGREVVSNLIEKIENKDWHDQRVKKYYRATLIERESCQRLI